MESNGLQILDTTLRDGSYVIDFQFTAEDTAIICSLLEFAGIPLIEVAHGLGLGADRAGKGKQASSDEAYLKAAASSVSKSKFGAFFIPGIGTEDDVRLAADCGAHFLRIGTNVNEVDQAEKFIKLANSLGLTTFSNLMKSYAVSDKEFAQYGRQAQDYGVDYLCLVDSAGGMLPDDVRSYIDAAHEACTIPVCFHGHNNLSMAVANTLEAVDAGAAIVDSSLQGMGRSEGNTMTEILVSILQKRGLMPEIDVLALLDASEAFIRPLLKTTGYTGIGVISGQAKFHSSFLGRILDAAQAYGIDPRDLILEITQRDQVEAPAELVDELAAELAKKPAREEVQFSHTPIDSQANGTLLEQAKCRACELREKARKFDLPSVLNIVVTPFELAHVSPYVETGFGCAISNVMLVDNDSLIEILNAIDGIVDFVLLDSGEENTFSPTLHSSVLLRYSDTEMWAHSALTHLTQLLGGSLQNKRISLRGIETLGQPLFDSLNRNASHVTTDLFTESPPTPPTPEFENSLSGADAIILISPRQHCIPTEMVQHIPEGALLYDAGIGSISPEALSMAEDRTLNVVRIDMRPALAATALELIQTRGIVDDRMGRELWNGVKVVAGGLIGGKGDIIVDHIQSPTRIIGVADGSGGLLNIDDSNGDIVKVRQAIAAKQLEQSR